MSDEGEHGGKVRLERDGTVAEVVLNRPDQLNALDGDCLEALHSHFTELAHDDDVRAILVRGEGRAFCAGADLDYVGDRVQDPLRFDAYLQNWHEIFGLIEHVPKATVAAVHGLALAGGFELMQVCDVVVLGDEARIGDQHANFGLFPGGGSTQRLPRLVGERAAKWLLFSGAWVDPDDALRMGLVTEVVAMDQVLPRAREMCELLASRSPLATANIKESVLSGMQMDLASALVLERRIAVQHMQSEDVQIGLRAFRDRTEPEFVGR